jgi:hypothetical protein
MAQRASIQAENEETGTVRPTASGDRRIDNSMTHMVHQRRRRREHRKEGRRGSEGEGVAGEVSRSPERGR